MRGRRVLPATVLTLGLLLASVTGLPSGAEDGHDPALVAAQEAVRPTLAPVPTVLTPVEEGVLPDPEALAAVVGATWAQGVPGAADSRAVVVADGVSGEVLLDRGGGRALTPASTVKVLTAAAVATAWGPQERFPTRAVRGGDPGEVVLVAGGDLLLSAGAGDPDSVAGQAGLADLAEQTAASLAQGSGSGSGSGTADEGAVTGGVDQGAATGPARPVVTVRVDTTYAEGADVAPRWTDFWVDNGFAGRIAMLGLEQDRALPYAPAPADPPLRAGRAFVEALREAGVEVSEEPVTRTRAAGASQGEVLGEVWSAPAREVTALALATSDNALVEQLARQAAVRQGVDADQGSVNEWVLARVQEEYGIDTGPVRLADTSGLSDGTAVPMRTLVEVLAAGSSGDHPGLAQVMQGLPVAALDGTLVDRFLREDATAGRGVVRAKTGSLPGVTALAGTLVTAEGRLLLFAVTATDVGDGTGALEARAALDAMVASLSACGC